jgi:hypothetical protein
MIFGTLYDTAIELFTAGKSGPWAGLSLHHLTEADAHTTVRQALLQRRMPGESTDTRFAILRVFLRNLVNTSYPRMSSEGMLDLLNTIEASATDEVARVALLRNALPSRLQDSLDAILASSRFEGMIDGLDWLGGRICHYGTLENTATINPEGFINDVLVLSRGDRKIPNMGIALAANLLADLGIRTAVKPDLHIKPTMAALGLGFNDADAIRAIIRIAQNEHAAVSQNPYFAWLGGLYPRDIDRLIYLIGSDNLHLDGRRRKRKAPARRALMIQRVREILGG